MLHIADSSGNILLNYRYDGFGNQLSFVETDTNPFRYCGEYFDRETGTYYLRARNYNPFTGRFTTEDAAKDGLNWYMYCAHNPILLADASGRTAYAVQDHATGKYGITVIPRDIEGYLLAFSSIPYLGIAIDLVWSLNVMFVGWEEIDKSDFELAIDRRLQGLSVLDDATSFAGKIGALSTETAKAFGDVISKVGKITKVTSAISIGDYFWGAEQGVIDQILQKRFSEEMLSDSELALQYKYLLASQKMGEYIDAGLLTYTTKGISSSLVSYDLDWKAARHLTRNLKYVDRMQEEDIYRKVRDFEILRH